VGISEIAALPVRMGAAVRNRRLFHPDGVLARGTLTRIAPLSEGLPMTSGDIVGRVSKEQAADYAQRKGVSLQQVERWLASNLDYDPE